MRALGRRCGKFAVGLLLLSLARTVLAQAAAPEPIVTGERWTLTSAALHEERAVLVSKPARYDAGEARYTVLYVLDGDTSFNYTSALVQFLAANRSIPPMLVVAVPNTNRPRDLTPALANTSAAEPDPNTGGAAAFRTFIASELVPWVEQHYRTRPYRILVGYSLGGLFVIDTLLDQPALFNAYLAISPSLWWDDQRTVERATTFFATQRELNATLYMTMADETGDMPSAAKKLAGLLDEKAPATFAWRFDTLPEETHGSTPLRSTYQGLEFIFADWRVPDPFETYNRFGIEAVERFYLANGAKYGEERTVLDEDTIVPIMLGLMDAERVDELAALLNRFRGITKPSAGFFEDVAALFRKRGDVTKAIDFYRRALEVDPERTESRQALEALTKSAAQ